MLKCFPFLSFQGFRFRTNFFYYWVYKHHKCKESAKESVSVCVCFYSHFNSIQTSSMQTRDSVVSYLRKYVWSMLLSVLYPQLLVVHRLCCHSRIDTLTSAAPISALSELLYGF